MLLQFFGKGLRKCGFRKFQSQSIENVQNSQWLSHKNILIFQTEGYFKNPWYGLLAKTYALSVGFKMKPLKWKCFSVLRQKSTQT